jgi:isoleucyl-tRNA synthetase
MDYKATLLLPKTDFPMRAELPKREPAQLAKWSAENIDGQILAARAEAAKKRETTFILHDGPPFANGDAHMGHALNMVLKDIVLKFQNMSGHYAPFVPGWDCHGLPIEFKVMKELGAAETDPIKIREKCEATARHFVEVQREQFQRLGVFGDWAHPYLTLDPAYEAETLRVFADLVGKNLVYQGLRPVYWSTGCQTALAEAEIEYKERIDPAIYVQFPLSPETAEKVPELKDTSLLLWTTTPWTLPANLAVAVAPNLDYAVYQIGNRKLLFHPGLLEKIIHAASLGHTDPIAGADPASAPRLVAGPWKGGDLLGLTYLHPFLDRTGKIYAGDFVTADAGTGLVHIAPGHGQDDYQLGQQHGLPVLAPVDDRGCLTAECGVPELVGQYVFKANPLIIELLRQRHALWAEEEYRHEYPHCWRSKTPIVFRAVKQWFIQVEAFRADALKAIDTVTFFPENGRNRIRGAVESRPDWCISRQRTWGIPLPVFYDPAGQPVLDEETVRKFADLVQKRGTGIWFAQTADELARDLDLPLGLTKGRDTLDVWIDSGTSWAAVLGQRAGLPFPADLYLEGSDQHRGWFQSSLLTSVAVNGQAPYRAILTNGFVVDIEGKKLSKSGTGYQKPVDLMTLVKEHGADVLRLWVASQDYQDDIPFSTDIFARVADSYRSIRNTLRILLGNLSDFQVAIHAVPCADWTPLDAYMHAKYEELLLRVLGFYRDYQFSQVYQAINRFCAVDLSAFYVDILKDRLYCDAQNSPVRRAAQTVIFEITSGLIRLLAPILPFTAEEAWQTLGQPGSVHTQTFPALSPREKDPDLLARWTALLDQRNQVNEKLETARREKRIGKSVEALVHLPGLPGHDGLLERDLDELFMVSDVILAPPGTEISVAAAEKAGYQKCTRCWKYYEHLGPDPAHPELCERCTTVVLDFAD